MIKPGCQGERPAEGLAAGHLAVGRVDPGSHLLQPRGQAQPVQLDREQAAVPDSPVPPQRAEPAAAEAVEQVLSTLSDLDPPLGLQR